MVHISSCATIWPGGPSSPGQGTRHFDSEARSQEGDVYGINKRLQEEMCRQVYDHCQLPIIVLRPDGICDARQACSATHAAPSPPPRRSSRAGTLTACSASVLSAATTSPRPA